MKVCPFCGSNKVWSKLGHGNITFIVCDGCMAVASFGPRKRGHDAIQAWNRRYNEEGTDGRDTRTDH